MYQETVTQANGLILIVDAQQRIAYLNPWGEHHLGMPPGSALHLTIAAFFTSSGISWPVPSRADWEQMIARPKEHGPIISHHAAPDGSVCWISWIASEWMNAGGHRAGTIVLGTDVSHYHHHDAAAGYQGKRDSAGRQHPEGMEGWYRTLFENTGTAMVILEEDLTIHSFNAEFIRLTAIPAEELQQKRVFKELVSDEDYDRLVAYHKLRCQEGGQAPSEYEGQLVTRQGRHKFVSLKVDIIPDTRLTIVSLLDISGRKHAETAYRESQQRLKRLLDNMPGMAYSIEADEHKTISMVSQGALAFTGFDAETLVGSKFEENFDNDIHPDDAENVREAVEAALETGQPFESVFRLRMASGEYKWVRNRGVGVYDAQGELMRLEGLVTDIDASKQAELELNKENQRLRSSIKDRFRFGRIFGRSEPMQQVYEMILRAAAANANVIIYGESGTGKELVSRAIHDLSDRREQAFVPVNCGAIPESLLESEFFGYKKGAFTGADRDKSGFLDLAHGGTLFLDEVGEIGPAMQVKLLRAIEGGGYTPVGGKQTRKTDIRIVAATNRDTLQMVRDGQMREDFYYRVHIIPVHLPPLRDRRSDIPLLVEHFMTSYGDEGRRLYPLSGNVMEQLSRYHWPGNVRELQNVLHRYVTLGRLVLEDVGGGAQPPDKGTAATGLAGSVDKLADAVGRFEKAFLLERLQQQRWHVSRTAAALGVNRRTLQRKMKRYGLY
jgi:PAS domain S-box-containing protein